MKGICKFVGGTTLVAATFSAALAAELPPNFPVKAPAAYVTKAPQAPMRLLDNPDIVFRFDVVEVLLPDEGDPRLELIQDAFELSQPYIY